MYYVVNQSVVKTDIKPEQMKPHVDYVHELIDSGIVVASGPFSDEKGGGMIVFNSDTEQEVKALVEKDPAVISGFLRNDIRPYRLYYLDTNHSVKS